MKITCLEKVAEKKIPDGVMKMSYASEVDGIKDWALIWPNKSKSWVIQIHGHGSHGDQLYTREDVRNAWVPWFRSQNLGILTPNLRDNGWMSPNAVSDMYDLINFLRNEYDAEKFIFFGGSMGGTSNLIYSLLHPNDVTAAVALGSSSDLRLYYYWCKQREQVAILKEISATIEFSYGGNPKECPVVFEKHSVLGNSEKFKVPLFLVHGAADETIPVEQSRILAEKLANLSHFQYHEIPNGDHDSPLYFTEKAFSWLEGLLK